MSKVFLIISCAALILIGSISFGRNVSGSLNEQPTVVAAVAAILPSIARQARVESDVKVEVKIDEKGMFNPRK